MDIKDIYLFIDYIYECDYCGQRFPVWWVSDEEWELSGLENKATICKNCYEKLVPNPRYYTMEEYIEKRDKPNEETARKILLEIWNMPAEYETSNRITRKCIEGEPAMKKKLRRNFRRLPVGLKVKLQGQE